ncbi:alpha-1,3-arabinosyltransferase XAT2-like isoform X1 [Phoenix dactylifera]|uniref:Alpha-1,3-arabinosyltransferase XAT2-like isoform X1 n=1 Tax=Phoenix dactylifera TaxID=42345 RepID=A0A8B7BGJ0_PHODC|nr:alpha-1,3-arabinosyltransferase XAT2-like isoform X1 [Phoenix dactylifera]
MANKFKLVRNSNRESQRFRIVVFVIGCFLVSMTFIVVSQPQSIPFPILGSKPSVHVAPSTPKAEDTGHSQRLGEISGQDNATEHSKQEMESNNEIQEKIIEGDDLRAHQDEVGGEINSAQKETLRTTDKLESNNSMQEISTKSDESNSHGGELHRKFTLPTISNYTINDSLQVENASNAEQLGKENETTTCDPNSGECDKDGEAGPQGDPNPAIADPTQEQNTSNSKQLGVGGQNMMNSEKKPLCDFSHYRVDRCELEGDIRIHRNPSSVISVESTERSSESYRIRPYPRKGDKIALSRVTEVMVKSSKDGPQCSINHNVPALVFSVGGYTGNLFHDFTDVMIPIFLTASEFNGEVQFVITETRPWWMKKYLTVFQKLSRYEIIDFDNDDRVHCFKHVAVGLRAQMEFTIDPAQDPNGYTMVDFARFMRSVYSLERDAVTRIEEHPHRKPRLTIISRQRTRKFTNVPEIVRMAQDLGYEVVVEEAGVSTNVAQFARNINSCDVLMGVHGAGLTNLVFLPMNATIIQIVPWGGLEGIAMFDFGHGAKAMKLNYVQYSISVEESTLTEIYPRNHPVFKNPTSFHKQGWVLLRGTFMDKQNVKLDVNRFRDVLWKALEHMMQ